MPRPSFPKSLRQFQHQFASEDACAEYLTACRWPDGFRCPKCGQTSAYGLAGRRRWQCASCRYQVSVTAGTILHNSKTPLTTWFWAAYLMTTDKRGLSALLLQQQLGLSRYETAWMLLHKLRRAMVNAARDPLRGEGEVEMDETWGAVASSEGATPRWFWLRSNGGGGRPVESGWRSYPISQEPPSRSSLPETSPQVPPSPPMVSQASRCSRRAAIPMCHERSHPRSSCAKEPSPSFRLPIGNLQGWLVGTHHGVSRGQLQVYLDEFVFRTNRRREPRAAFQPLLGLGSSRGPTAYAQIQHARDRKLL